jgi:hypothetical protein
MISTFLLFCDFSMLSLNTDVNEPTVRNKYKNLEKHSYFVGILKAIAKKGRIRIRYLVFGTKDLYPYLTLKLAWPEAIACHRPRWQGGVIRTYPPPSLIVHSHGQKSVIFRKSS